MLTPHTLLQFPVGNSCIGNGEHTHNRKKMTLLKIQQDPRGHWSPGPRQSKDKKPTCISQVLHPQQGKNLRILPPLALDSLNNTIRSEHSSNVLEQWPSCSDRFISITYQMWLERQDIDCTYYNNNGEFEIISIKPSDTYTQFGCGQKFPRPAFKSRRGHVQSNHRSFLALPSVC